MLGVDVSPSAIARARKRFAERDGLEFEVVDVTKANAGPDTRFDGVLDRGCLHGIPPTLAGVYAGNVSRWTRPGGSLVLIMRVGEDATMAQRLEQIDDLLDADFALAHSQGIGMPGEHRGEPIDGMLVRLVKRN
ncbi:hypothetical protein BH24ACT7_BH24ACT7_04810 [soil metagenome]